MSRIVFANQLRGLAALLVVFNHLILLYWAQPDIVNLRSSTPRLVASPPDYVTVLGRICSALWFNPGPFGVALFFLISGLVLPFSLVRHTRRSFLLARALRVYPTYIVGFVLQLAVVRWNAHYWHLDVQLSADQLIANCLLVYDWISSYADFDTVNWTLVIELKFYIMMALLANTVRQGLLLFLFVPPVLLLAVLALIGTDYLPDTDFPLVRIVFLDAPYLTFMLIGVLFNYRVRGLISLPALSLGIAGLLGVFLLSWTQSASSAQFPQVPVNYGYALAIFCILFLFRDRFRRSKVLDWLAAISFPLYLIHALVGYSALKFLMIRLRWDYPPALLLTLVLVGTIATILHIVVETPTIALGRALSTEVRSPPFAASQTAERREGPADA